MTKSDPQVLCFGEPKHKKIPNQFYTGTYRNLRFLVRTSSDPLWGSRLRALLADPWKCPPSAGITTVISFCIIMKIYRPLCPPKVGISKRRGVRVRAPSGLNLERRSRSEGTRRVPVLGFLLLIKLLAQDRKRPIRPVQIHHLPTIINKRHRHAVNIDRPKIQPILIL